MVALCVVDWPFFNGGERLKSCGLTVNVLPAAETRICDMSPPVLFVTLNV